MSTPRLSELTQAQQENLRYFLTLFDDSGILDSDELQIKDDRKARHFVHVFQREGWITIEDGCFVLSDAAMEVRKAGIQAKTAMESMCALQEAVPEDDEPPMCSCGKHYVGAPCSEGR
jgi:hypothetical protein